LGDQPANANDLRVRYCIPYSDLANLNDPDVRNVVLEKGEPVQFGHTLADQIGGQLEAGLLLAGFYEDRYPNVAADPISRYIDTFIATRAIKP
jgi:hypothetical protein